jgi:hypothetical protein
VPFFQLNSLIYLLCMYNIYRFQLMHELLPTKKYFEFGCGGSTILASRMITTFNLSLSVTSIDSSSSWVSKMKEDLGDILYKPPLNNILTCRNLQFSRNWNVLGSFLFTGCILESWEIGVFQRTQPISACGHHIANRYGGMAVMQNLFL